MRKRFDLSSLAFFVLIAALVGTVLSILMFEDEVRDPPQGLVVSPDATPSTGTVHPPPQAD